MQRRGQASTRPTPTGCGRIVRSLAGRGEDAGDAAHPVDAGSAPWRGWRGLVVGVMMLGSCGMPQGALRKQWLDSPDAVVGLDLGDRTRDAVERAIREDGSCGWERGTCAPPVEAVVYARTFAIRRAAGRRSTLASTIDPSQEPMTHLWMAADDTIRFAWGSRTLPGPGEPSWPDAWVAGPQGMSEARRQRTWSTWWEACRAPHAIEVLTPACPDPDADTDALSDSDTDP